MNCQVSACAFLRGRKAQRVRQQCHSAGLKSNTAPQVNGPSALELFVGSFFSADGFLMMQMALMSQ